MQGAFRQRRRTSRAQAPGLPVLVPRAFVLAFGGLGEFLARRGLLSASRPESIALPIGQVPQAPATVSLRVPARQVSTAPTTLAHKNPVSVAV